MKKTWFDSSPYLIPYAKSIASHASGKGVLITLITWIVTTVFSWIGLGNGWLHLEEKTFLAVISAIFILPWAIIQASFFAFIAHQKKIVDQVNLTRIHSVADKYCQLFRENKNPADCPVRLSLAADAGIVTLRDIPEVSRQLHAAVLERNCGSPFDEGWGNEHPYVKFEFIMPFLAWAASRGLLMRSKCDGMWEEHFAEELRLANTSQALTVPVNPLVGNRPPRNRDLITLC